MYANVRISTNCQVCYSFSGLYCIYMVLFLFSTFLLCASYFFFALIVYGKISNMIYMEKWPTSLIDNCLVVLHSTTFLVERACLYTSNRNTSQRQSPSDCGWKPSWETWSITHKKNTWMVPPCRDEKVFSWLNIPCCYFPRSWAVAKSMADFINIKQNDNKTCYRNDYADSRLFDSKIGKRLD